jgi:predicted O-methyltransferase YrrM
MGKPCNAATYRAATLKLAQPENPRLLVEVGVYAGALSQMFATIPSLERQIIVDSWLGGYSSFDQKHMDGIAKGVLDWAATQPKVEVYREDSRVAAKRFEDESIDFWHTDGDHSLEGIRGDIAAWLPKVKPGCILSGDNYEIKEVAQGVREAFPKHQLLANGRLWWVRK